MVMPASGSHEPSPRHPNVPAGKERLMAVKTRSLIPLIAFTPALITSAEAAAITSRVAPVLYVPTGATQYDGPQGKALLDYHASGVTRGLADVARWYARELPNDLVIWSDLIVFRGHYTSAQCLADMGPCI